MKRALGALGCAVALLAAGCGQLESGTTDPNKEAWAPGPLGGKADDTIVDKGSLAFGAQLTGISINKDELHRYTFFAIAGADISIAMSGDGGSGAPDTFLQLEAPGGKVYTDDDGGFGLNSLLALQGLPDSGTYTLYATTYRRAGSGGYSLGLTCDSGNCAVTPQMKTDDDHDGYSELDGDCDDTTPDASPAAPEIPGNNKDDNCDGKTDEGCNDPTTCDRPPKAVHSVQTYGKYNGYTDRCRVKGQAEPSTNLTIYSNSRRKTLQSNVTVPTSGTFDVVIYSSCYPGDVIVLWVADQTSQSGKVWHRVSGTDTYAPLQVDTLQATVKLAGQVQIDGRTELGSTVLLTNTSQQGQAVEVPAGAGFETLFSGALAANPGDWIQIQAKDPSGNLSQAAYAQVPGADSTAPGAPGAIQTYGKYNGYTDRCRVKGQAEPNSKLTVYSNSRRKTLQSNFTVPPAGAFDVVIYSSCYPGDVIVLWVSDGANESAKVTATVSGTDSYAPLAPINLDAGQVQGGQVTVSGVAEINGSVLLFNDSQSTGPVTAQTSWAGLDATFSATIGANAGDWLRLQAKDPAGNLSQAAMVQVSGADSTAPDAPSAIQTYGKYNGYTDRCRIKGQAEPNSKLTIYSNSRRKTLQSNVAVSAAGAFDVVIYSSCYPGDVVVLWVSDGVNNSAKVLATVSGTDSYAPLAPINLDAGQVQGSQVTVSGKAEINGSVLLYNDSQNAGPVTVQTSWVDLDAPFSVTIGANAGDWLRLQAKDPAGNLSQAAMVQVSGADNTAPDAPSAIQTYGKYNGYTDRCRIKGQAEPNSKLTIYSNSRRKTLQSNVAVSAAGAFDVVIYSSCYPGDVAVLWVSDGANDSAKVLATVSGTDSYAPLAPIGLNAGQVQGGQVTVSGKAEINGSVLLYNDSQNTGPVTVQTSWAGLDAPFSVTIGANAGDWLRLQAKDPAGNLSQAAMVQVSGADSTAPDAPSAIQTYGKYNGYTDRCRVKGQAEPNAKLTIYSNSRRKTLQSNVAVSAAGAFDVVIYSSCYPGDVIQLWVSDGSNNSPKVNATVSGTDTYAPLTPANVSVSGVVGGKVTVTATAEINGSLVVINTYDNSQHTGPANADGVATVVLPAWHGDQLKLQAKDAAGNLGQAVFAAVP